MKIASILFLLFVPVAVSGQGNIALDDGFYLGSASIHENGDVLVAQAHREGYDSILVLKKGPENRVEVAIPDLRVNAVRWLNGASQSFFLSGSTGHVRFSRIYRFDREMKLVKEWDSIHLPEALQATDLSVSKDGALWSASSFRDDSASVVVGSTAGYQSSWDWTVTVAEVQNLGDPLHSGSVILDSNPQRPSIALLWRGMIQVLRKGEPARQLLADPEFQVLGLYFQAETEILWGKASFGRLVGFRLNHLPRVVPSEPLRADFQIEPQDIGIKGIMALRGLEDGRMLLHAQISGGQALVSIETQMPDRLKPTELARLEPGGRIAGHGVLEPTAENGLNLEFELKPLPTHRGF